jgi:hypothetical protein
MPIWQLQAAIPGESEDISFGAGPTVAAAAKSCLQLRFATHFAAHVPFCMWLEAVQSCLAFFRQIISKHQAVRSSSYQPSTMEIPWDISQGQVVTYAVIVYARMLLSSWG